MLPEIPRQCRKLLEVASGRAHFVQCLSADISGWSMVDAFAQFVWDSMLKLYSMYIVYTYNYIYIYILYLDMSNVYVSIILTGWTHELWSGIWATFEFMILQWSAQTFQLRLKAVGKTRVTQRHQRPKTFWNIYWYESQLCLFGYLNDTQTWYIY